MKALLTITLATFATSLFGFEPVDRFGIDENRPSSFSEPCSDNWQRLHFWYSDVDTTCEDFRKWTLGCFDNNGKGWLGRDIARNCIVLVAMGGGQIAEYNNFAVGRWMGNRVHLTEPFDEQTKERVIQFVRVMFGYSPLKKNPWNVRSWLNRWQARLERENGNKKTIQTRNSVKWAARRTRIDP